MEERLGLRLPPELAARVRRIAETERRSVNRQLEVLIEEGAARWEAARGISQAPGSAPRLATGEAEAEETT